MAVCDPHATRAQTGPEALAANHEFDLIDIGNLALVRMCQDVYRRRNAGSR